MASGGSTSKTRVRNVNSKKCPSDSRASQKSADPEGQKPDDNSAADEDKVPLDNDKFIAHMSEFLTEQLSRSIYASLLNDYIESEFFVIDGDSLLLTGATNCSLKQGQNLHCCYLLERFLLNLKNKQARYVIVFFKDMEHMYFQTAHLMSLRTQLILHLQKNTDIAVHIFQGFLSDEWNNFISEQPPYFLMASDEGLNTQQTLFLNMLMLNALGSRIDVVLTAGLESDHLRVYGYHTKSLGLHRHFIQTHSKRFSKLTKTVTTIEKDEESKLNYVLKLFRKCNKQVQKSISLIAKRFIKQPDIRAITCVISCFMALNHQAKMDDNAKDDDWTLKEAADLCKMYCLSMALIMILPLSQRAKLRGINASWNSNAKAFLDMIKIYEYIALSQIEDLGTEEIDWTYVSDMSDNLLLKNIAYYSEREHAELQLEFGNEIDQMYKFLWKTILKFVTNGEQLQSDHLRTTSKPFLSRDSSLNEVQEEILQVGLIPIQSEVIEDFAGDTVKELPILSSDNPVVSSLSKKKSYDELRHWHSGRPLSDDYDRTKHDLNNALKDQFALRNYQKYQTFQHRYGKSLGMTAPKKIILKTEHQEENIVSKAPAKKGQPQKKKKDQIIEENQKRSKAKGESKEKEQWKTLEASLEREIRCNFFSGVIKFETFINSLQVPSVKYQAQLRALTIYYEVWLNECQMKSKDERDMNIVVEIIKMVQEIITNHNDILQMQDQHQIATFLNKLGFKKSAFLLMSQEVPSIKEEVLKSKYAVGVGSVRFQMQYMGPYLIRDERKDPDPRVQHFIPDTWQRELLDVVDNNESAVIVAPTSSGKTYASYYCMEKVLTQSNEGVVVYVAPTKALVNQVVATVTNMFNKDLPNGMALCGVFTRDYRTDALNSQVLVTVPQCLEILLLSPHRQKWVKRIKYVIFDEVHCLGGEIGAEVWEHLLAMIRCPFLALSATISNPKHLTKWLNSVRQYWQEIDEEETSDASKPTQKGKRNTTKTEKKSYKVRLVLHDKRFNDLETYICSSKDSNVKFEHVHPCAALTIDHMKSYGIPQDLSLSPRESLQLYDTMVKAWPTWPNMQSLDPEENEHLQGKIIIGKVDAIKYEKALKDEFKDWVLKGYDEKVLKVLKSFQKQKYSYVENWSENFPLLVEKLDKENKLPALFFAFDIKAVESLATDLGKHLITKWTMNDTEMKQIQKLKGRAAKIEKALHISSSNTDSEEINRANYNSIKQTIEKLTELPPECTFADEFAVDKETLEEIYWEVRHSRHADNLISLSQKGIGFHHGAVDAKGRRLVEMLFRMGYIRVVTATSSLALGINMPCRSVVFIKDSVFLDALNYRQMAGRAGRRGLDLLGSVYFYNIPMPKVKRLMKSNVPQLRGQFPLSISFILRLMLLASKADDKEDAKAKVLSALKHSLMSFKQTQETKMLKLYCVFSLQFLLYEGYLDKDCNPTTFTGLVTHLHYHEPSNMVFVSFLEKGLFHQLCKPSSKGQRRFPKSVMEDLVLVLAHLFGRHFLLPCRFSSERRFFQSKVYLGKLPDVFAAAVEEYNRKVATVFGNFILTASTLANLEKEYQLPLSKIDFSGVECLDSGLVNHLMSCSEGRSSISPFACLSGNTNQNLMSVTNVSDLMLQTAHISDKHIPILHLEKTDACGRVMPLNSYVLDFFKHGSLSAIVKDNGFNEGDAYNLLRDFYLVIASISVSMKEMCEDEYDPVAMAFDQVKTMYHQLLPAFPSRA